MNWYNDNKLEIAIKNILKSNSFTSSLMNYYDILESDLDNSLKIIVTSLDGKFAESNSKEIILDSKIVNDKFFTENFHFVIHEFFHWLKRRNEKRFYFNDPEEVQSFVLAIAWEIINGTDKEVIKKKIYPIVKTHFCEETESYKIFEEMMQKAYAIASKYNN
jgi:hypothetical protein